MKIFTKTSVNQFLHVFVIVFPLTLIIPKVMGPLLALLELAVKEPTAVFLIDIVIVGLAIFILVPLLKTITSKLFS